MIAEKWYDTNDILTAHYKYVYDSEGNIIRSIDILGKKEYTYLYGDNGISCVTEYDITVSGETVTSRQIKNKIRNFYNEDGKLYKKRINDRDIFYNHTDNEDSSTSSIATDGNVSATIVKDGLGRKDTEEVSVETVTTGRWFEYVAGHQPSAYSGDYLPEAYVTSNLVSRMCIYSDGIYRYTYDKEDRITKVTGPDTTINYTYDSQGQLLTEKRGNTTLNTMTYDAYGNILTKNGKAYVYDTVWKDLLLSYGGQSITYDAQGNPTNYLGHTLTWEKGRQLKSFDSNTYTYNANGIRTSKTVGGVKHEYILEGSKILKETWGNNTLVPIYDAENSVVGIKYNDIPYLFQRSLQNDIVGIVDSTGTTIAKYSYDAWGVCTVTSDTSGINLAAINPYRYRSYYYDTEIGLYYLQSRYYDPVVGRFINADVVESLGLSLSSYFDSNLYIYCHNNPVFLQDGSGFAVETVFDIASCIWSLIEVVTSPSWTNFFYFLWDLASILVPCIPGSYVNKAGKLVIMVANSIDDFVDGTEFLTDTYKNLRKIYKGVKDIEIHHLVEKRFYDLFRGVNVDDYLSIPLTKDLHKVITSRWRNLNKKTINGKKVFAMFGYGKDYSKITYEQMELAIKEVYHDMPQLLEQTLAWFRKNFNK